MISQLNVSSQTFKGGLLSVNPAKATKVASRQIEQMSAYPISFNAMQIMTHSKGSSPQVARQLKELDGTLDEKLLKAKDIILKDMNIPSDLVKCVDYDLGKVYASYNTTQGVIAYNKKFCQEASSDFSDDAVLCILRHELDHMVVFSKLYKSLGKEGFEKLITGNKALMEVLPPQYRKINFDFYEKMAPHVSIEGFEPQKYIEAWNSYYTADNIGTSQYKSFNDIIKNFDNELEKSARDKQYELEDLMGVTTLKDFYSMIDETKALTLEIKAKGIVDEELINKTFDDLYHQAVKETGLEDKTSNWGKILKQARAINNTKQ